MVTCGSQVRIMSSQLKETVNCSLATERTCACVQVEARSKGNIQRDSKRWTHFVSFYGLNSKRRLNTRHTVGCGIPKFSARCTCWLAWAALKILFSSSHILLWYTWSAGAFAFTQTAYLLKSVIPKTNALPRWRLNVETKTKRTLYSSRRLSFNEITNVKNLV